MIVSDVPPYMRSTPLHVRMKCRELVLDAARRHGIPPAYVTAHIRQAKAVQARREVWLQMLEMGLTRGVIAYSFNRDLRRVRCRAIGGPKPKKGFRRPLDYSKVDLLGQPLDQKESAPRVTRSALSEAWMLLATLLPDHPVARDWRQRNARFGR